MTGTQVLVVLFTAGNLTGMVLNVRGNPAGWFVVAAAQALFGTYLAVSDQWLVGLPQYGCLAIACWGAWRWSVRGVHHTGAAERRDRRATDR